MGKGKQVSRYMNLQAVANLNQMSFHVLIERVESGHFMVSVPELVDCVASPETLKAAIATVQEKVRARLANIEVLTLEVANNPWTEFIGMFEGDDEFAELVAKLRKE